MGRLESICSPPMSAPPSAIPAWKLCLLVALGGAIGALARFSVELGLVIALTDPFLAASLSLGAVNVLGAGGLGGLLGRIERQGGPAWLRPFLGTGFFGTFTTFSGFIAHLRVLEAEAGAAATALFFVASCACGAILFHALHGSLPPEEARS